MLQLCHRACMPTQQALHSLTFIRSGATLSHKVSHTTTVGRVPPAQVQSHLWVRNGDDVLNSIKIYYSVR